MNIDAPLLEAIAVKTFHRPERCTAQKKREDRTSAFEISNES
ncbi:hypothetical protein [Pseudomonas asturiensis]|nr:hypothetical protein [Pseudomonas asturiensis]